MLGRTATPFPFPCAVAGLQLGTAAVVLAAWTSARPGPTACAALPPAQEDLQRAATWHKAKTIGPAGALLGFNYCVNNYALYLVPTSVHVLLHCTGLLWQLLISSKLFGHHFTTLHL